MCVALFVALLASGEIQAVANSEPLKSEIECLAMNARVDAAVKAGMVPGVVKYSLSCVKVELK